MSARGRLTAREAAAWNRLQWQLTAEVAGGALPPAPEVRGRTGSAAPMKRAVAALLLGASLVAVVTRAAGGSTAVAVAAVTAWIGAVSTVTAVFGHRCGAARRPR
ncbi:hypothetical protein [Streptomyces katrae]|uniref:hypothetical protein n=1 Tax=Streptomyces katrae TaxID=68223 RepID=UPI0004C153EF|nr:hypothetical protein [Streptomyces katrae]